ncbi:hypothetical protein DL98DRAFT_586350 [Cadophora sp. DSE1049]|nr:hypothetical protein DL98DRAFT_586350 [Cadophora sp. DSE1049]
MADTAKKSRSGLPSVSHRNTVSQLLEKSHPDAGSESLRKDSLHFLTFEQKQPTHSSKSHSTISRKDGKQSSSLTHEASMSSQVSSLDVNHTKSNCSSTAISFQGLTSNADLSATSMHNDLLSISAWTYLYDNSHCQYLHPSLHSGMDSTCLNHTPLGLGSHMAGYLSEPAPLDRWINEAPGEGYDVVVQLRHQEGPDCACIAIQDVIGEDIDGISQQDTWGI